MKSYKAQYFKNVIFLIVLLLVASSCASRSGNLSMGRAGDNGQLVQDSEESREKAKTVKRDLSLKTITLQPGRVKLVKIPIGVGLEGLSLSCRKERIPAYSSEGHYIFYLRETYFSKLKNFNCRLRYFENDKEFNKIVLNVVVKKFPYKEEFLNVDRKRVWPSKKDQQRAAREQKMLNKLYKVSAQLPLFNRPFVAPLNSKITSIYGNRRVFNNNKKSQHLGTDFRAAVGTPIPTANRGKVVYAGDLFYSGKTVIIDHGLNIFTVYGHLSELQAQAGEIVSQGNIIGLSGATGRVSGPHLHWGVKILGQYINGFSLIDEGV